MKKYLISMLTLCFLCSPIFANDELRGKSINCSFKIPVQDVDYPGLDHLEGFVRITKQGANRWVGSYKLHDKTDHFSHVKLKVVKDRETVDQFRNMDPKLAQQYFGERADKVSEVESLYQFNLTPNVDAGVNLMVGMDESERPMVAYGSAGFMPILCNELK